MNHLSELNLPLASCKLNFVLAFPQHTTLSSLDHHFHLIAVIIGNYEYCTLQGVPLFHVSNRFGASNEHRRSARPFLSSVECCKLVKTNLNEYLHRITLFKLNCLNWHLLYFPVSVLSSCEINFNAVVLTDRLTVLYPAQLWAICLLSIPKSSCLFTR